ncbi:MAG: aminotransferase class V-fold PLP-dependent enzyme [Bacteroidales bacterium]|jgi:aspartate aminotransferase-like enzyme|nr:aminotransferase class V-fold PLP-dependent enzyme [Bacteroidales bacterium]
MKLFTPGPIAMDSETIAIGGIQSQYFRTPAFSQKMLNCMEMLKIALDAPEESRIIFLTASGTAAMEASVINLFSTKDKLLIISGGTFGKRFKQICDIYQIPNEVISLGRHESLDVEILKQYKDAGITGMLINMCETSTGQLYPMEDISNFCKNNHICLVVDAISSFLCDPFSMKKSGASAVIISSQKGLALQPGMSFVAITKEAFDDRCVKINPRTLYFNFTNYYPEILRGQTEYTPAIGIINQLEDKLSRILKNGVQTYINHCNDLAQYFRESLVKFTSLNYVDYPLSNCVTPVLCKNNNAKKIVATLRDKHDIYVVPAAKELSDSMFRVAHMSIQLQKKDIDELITLLKEIDSI